MTTYNITGGSTALTDALGVPLQNAVVRLTPHATSDANVVGSTVKLGSIEYTVPSLPDPLAVDGGYWDVLIQSTALVRRSRSFTTSLPAFQAISTTINLTADTTWAAIVSGAVSDVPFTPSLVQQAQASATAAANSATAAASSAASVAAIPTTTDTLVASKVGDTTSATRATLVDNFVPLRGQQLRTLETAFARRDVDILVIGDSISEGTGPTLIEKRWPSRLRDSLRAQLGLPAGGRGYVPAHYAVPAGPTDTLWVASGGAVDANTLTRGLGKRGYRLLGAGQKVTLTVPVGHTDVDVLITASTAGTSIFTPTVDGAVGANVNAQTAGTATERDIVFSVATGLDPTVTHTIDITWASGNVWVSGAMLYAAGEKAGGAGVGGVGSGVRLWDGSHHGQGSQFFATSTEIWNYTINTVQPDLVMIALGRNNWSAGDRTPAQVRADIEALIASVKAQTTIAPAFVIMAVYGNQVTGTPVAPWSDYANAMRDSALAGGYGFIDLSKRMGTITDAASNALGLLTTDYVHPSDTGSQLMSDVVGAYLNPKPPQPYTPTNVTDTQVSLNSASGIQRAVAFFTGGKLRWMLRANTTAETGANAGSDFELLARDDSGNPLKTILQIFRSNGRIFLGDGVDISVGTTSGTRFGMGTTQKLAFYGSPAVAKPAAITATPAAAPAGGTGTAAGGWDTAANRDAAIATINALKTRVDDLENRLKSLGLLS